MSHRDEKSPNAPLLAIDTSGFTARVALVGLDNSILAAGERTSDRHSGTLLPLCRELLDKVGVTVDGLRAIACGQGPGSFTGLRVGLAVAKGLALPFDLPLLLVSSLEALALDLGDGPVRAPCIDAGKGEVYGQLFKVENAATANVTLTPLTDENRFVPSAYVERLLATGQPVLMGGTGFDRHEAIFRAALANTAIHGAAGFPGPSARAIAKLGLMRLARGERDDLAQAVPSYGRPPDITAPKRRPPPAG